MVFKQKNNMTSSSLAPLWAPKRRGGFHPILRVPCFFPIGDPEIPIGDHHQLPSGYD